MGVATMHDETFSHLRWIEEWVAKNIHRPIKGFEHKRNPDGSYYSFSQQMRETHRQAIAVAKYFLQRGKSTEEVCGVLAHFR
jgi:hypothetical protein